MKKLILIFAMFLIAKSQGGVPPGAQGIGINPPKAMLEVKGEIKIDSARSTPTYDGMIQYKLGQFLFRQNGAWLPLGSGSNVSNGIIKRNDTLMAGGRLKESLVYKNATDTIFFMDTIGHIKFPGIYSYDNYYDAGVLVDSVFKITNDNLIDSILNVIGLLPNQYCRVTDTTGIVDKLNKDDNIKYTFDTTNMGSCSGTTYISLLQFKFAPTNIPKDSYVDSFLVYFSGYDTLNMGGSTSGENKPIFLLNQGRNIIYSHYSTDTVLASLSEPFDTGEDTIGLIMYHFPGKKLNSIDSITLTVLFPRDPTNPKYLADRLGLVFPLKASLRNVVSWNDNLITIPYSNNSYQISTTTLSDSLAKKTNKLISFNAYTTSDTLRLTDADKVIEMNVGTANDLVIPTNTAYAFPVGTQIVLIQIGTGQTTIVPASGVTVHSSGSKLKLTGQYSGATIIKKASNEWYLFGDITN